MAGARPAQRNEKVFRNDTTGFVMSRKMAFVREAEYETKVGQAIPQADLLTLPGYDRVAAKVRGTVLMMGFGPSMHRAWPTPV